MITATDIVKTFTDEYGRLNVHYRESGGNDIDIYTFRSSAAYNQHVREDLGPWMMDADDLRRWVWLRFASVPTRGAVRDALSMLFSLAEPMDDDERAEAAVLEREYLGFQRDAEDT